VNQSVAAFDAATLSACDREPIRVPAAIQPHGALLAVDPAEWRIVHAAGAAERLLGIAAAALPGRPLTDLFDAAQRARLAGLLAAPGGLDRPDLAFTRNAVDVIAHRNDRCLLLECEERATRAPHDAVDDPIALVQRMSRNVEHAATARHLCDEVAREIRAVTDFARVMVYRFDHDGSGAVIAEARDAATESFLGLHYPAGDIPRQARDLYRSSTIRAIPDARYEPAPLIPPRDPRDGAPVDLGRSVLRSVSPVHRQYLANMGVVASMSVSLVLHGKLWGLIACHHPAPHRLPFRLREACALFADMAATRLQMALAAEQFEGRLQATRVHEDLLARLAQESDPLAGLRRWRRHLAELVPAAGLALVHDGACTHLGATPDDAQVGGLVAWLDAGGHDGVFHTDCLALAHPPSQATAEIASGLLAVAVSRAAQRDWVLWFRPEVVRTVTWAGNPAKPADADILTPRASFAAWREAVRWHARPWLEAEIEAARRLRLALLEVVLPRHDERRREREAAQAEQHRLSAELDERLAQWRGLAAALRDETTRRAAAEADLSDALRHARREQEAERLRIARELHDTLGQSLTLLQLGLEGLGRQAGDNAEVQQRLAGLKTLAADVGRDVSRLAREIRPAALDDLGIGPAIRGLLESWSAQSGIGFDLHVRLDGQRLSAEIETTLYRVLQEALTNILRHAEARHVGVILAVAKRELAMIVEDDGQGFPPAPPSSPRADAGRRLGLVGMRERVAAVGGALEIESAPGRGATLFVRIPV
jgi:light-regulated signal transduction histidine kinase (bacteriophytochrome)